MVNVKYATVHVRIRACLAINYFYRVYVYNTRPRHSNFFDSVHDYLIKCHVIISNAFHVLIIDWFCVLGWFCASIPRRG